MKKFIIGFYRKCDLLTMTGVFLAVFGIFLSIQQYFAYATLCMILCGICDAFDGKLARKYKYEKNAQVYGVQLDSLADVICSGVFPAIITAMQSPSVITCIVCAFYILCGVIRLAYFNTMAADENVEKNVYFGLPITTVCIAYPATMLITRTLFPSASFIVMPILLAVMGCLFIANVRIPKPDVSKIFRKIFNPYAVELFFFPAFLVLASDLYYKLNFEGNALKSVLLSVKGHFFAFLLLLVFFSAFHFLLVSLFGNSKIAKAVTAVLTALLLTISDVKLAIMGIPLQFSDVNYLNPDNLSMMGTATTTIGTWIWKVILKTVLFLLIAVVFLIFDRKEHTFKFKSIKIRILSAALALIFAVLFPVLGIFSIPVLPAAYGISADDCCALPETEELFLNYGYWQGFFLDSIAANYVEPMEYDKESIDREVAETAKDKISGNWGKANVVFILSETFTDLENMSEVRFDKPLTPNIDAYEKDDSKLVFDLLVPSFGGASVNTEFEILTGSSLALWPSGFIPYTSYYDESNGGVTPNLIQEFNHNGYETMYFTPWGSTSYKSEYVYSLFGADQKIYGDSLSGENKGYYYSDKSLMDDLFAQLKDTSEGNYKFIMTATAENHFPYDADKFDAYDIEAFSDTLNEEQLGMIRSYAQGIYDADKELNRLYEMIQTLDVPTILVFYGDHLPHIVDSKENTPYLDSSYFNTENEALNQF
ncbi:MAG: sulfatase-like hydrolase/transferase, partial [Clostridia bacterium]|nr:sulfatase-like hydrolase/transferase [Clostridia bacterium]